MLLPLGCTPNMTLKKCSTRFFMDSSNKLEMRIGPSFQTSFHNLLESDLLLIMEFDYLGCSPRMGRGSRDGQQATRGSSGYGSSSSSSLNLMATTPGGRHWIGYKDKLVYWQSFHLVHWPLTLNYIVVHS
ncbi:Hypothetical predicted protein [Octopus vulgaris]|uniref:Uncharacterized protein n=1 Tax=Octopus vulgaris TaxID=6645 RepID=A0AA36ARG6_OCTVU|nr:Hypothetical predicted protein [Octopus vulgaris]